MIQAVGISFSWLTCCLLKKGTKVSKIFEFSNLKGGLLAKSRKLFFSRGGHFWRAKSKKCKKKLFSKNFSEWLFLMVMCVKLKVDRTKVVSVFKFGPYFGSKWLLLSFFGIFTWNQCAQYGLYRYLNDWYDLTNDLGQ